MFLTLLIALVFSAVATAEMNIPIQLRLKSPGGTYPTENNLSFKLVILAPATGCILREEDFSSQTITNGNVSISLGAGVRGVSDPSLTLNQVYDNSKTKTGLTCVDANNAIISTGQSFVPANSDGRIIRVLTTIGGEPVLANFNMRATPYAIQAESVGGKSASDLIVKDVSSQMNQTNLNDLLLDLTRFNNLKNIALSGQANTAVTATSFSGALTGDVNGTQTATSVDRIKGITISTIAPLMGQVLQFNGTQYVPANVGGATVTSVAGKTGAVVLTSSDISGLGSAAGLNVGVAAGQVVQLDGTARIPASTLPANALTTASSFSGDVSGTSSTLSVDRIKGTAVNAAAPIAGQALVYDGTQWIPTTGFPTFSRKTADEIFSVVGVANVTSLSFPVVAGQTYKYKFSVLYTSASTGNGLRLGLTYPAVTNASAWVNIASGGDGTAAYYQGVINSSGDSVRSPNTPAIAPAVMLAHVEGIIDPTAAGSVQLTAAPELNAVDVVILAGSFVEVVVVP